MRNRVDYVKTRYLDVQEGDDRELFRVTRDRKNGSSVGNARRRFKKGEYIEVASKMCTGVLGAEGEKFMRECG